VVGTQGFSLKVVTAELTLAEKFSIATESWDSSTNVFALATFGDFTGVGEVSPDPRSDHTVESVTAEIEAVDLNQMSSPFDIERLAELMPPTPARCAVDIALHDLAARTAGISVAEFLGLGGRLLPVTSMTIPIESLDVMIARATRLSSYPALKLKVGFEGDVDAVAAIREIYPGRIRIDANEGWSADQAVDRLGQLASLDIELCEQPVPMGDFDGWAKVKAASSIPVYADEDAGTANDVARLAGIVDGVNFKLRKAGGIRELMKGMAVARSLGMGVMIGCDLETGIAATAGASVASLCDFVDMDGPTLLAEDPFPGVTYDLGALALPSGPGLGVTKVPE
jgi:L-Ala-D/L-Glu epimerase